MLLPALRLPVQQPQSAASASPAAKMNGMPAVTEKSDEALDDRDKDGEGDEDDDEAADDAILQKLAESSEQCALAIEANVDAVDAAIAAVNAQLAMGMDWHELDRLIADERAAGARPQRSR